MNNEAVIAKLEEIIAIQELEIKGYELMPDDGDTEEGYYHWEQYIKKLDKELIILKSELSALRSEPEEKHEFTPNDVDGAYFMGVFNSTGIDGLANEIKRIKKIGLLPHQSIEIFKRIKE